MQCRSALAGPTYVLLSVATIMLQIALYDRQGLITHEWVQLLLVCGLGLMIQRSDRWTNRRDGNAVATVGFCVIAGLPFAADVAQRTYTLFGNPFEIQLILCLRNLMIGLGLRSRDSRSLVFASLASGFLTLYSFLWLMNRWTIALMFLYAIIGMWWLMGIYWDRLSGSFMSRSERRIPWRPVLGATGIGIVALLASLPIATGKNYTTAIQGLLPSSGGTGGQDEFAFGGVGDGPQMVSAKEDASGFGPIESELFLESKMPSLYDTLNEFSDASPKPKNKGRQRAIPLAPSQMKLNHKRRGVNQRAGREFSTVRRQKQGTPEVQDLRSRALLQVVGRVPVHLGIYAYDSWDGRHLSSTDTSQACKLTLETNLAENKNWALFVDRTPDACLSYHDHHELRIINLKTNRVPAPPNVAGIHIDKLHTETLFQSSSDGMLAMAMDHIPQLSILHIKSLQRGASQLPLLVRGDASTLTADDSLAAMASDWTNGVRDGWSEIEAVCARLRQEYILAPLAMVPEEAGDAARYFLMESKCGPDYLFATSAALMIRTLGYETRVVSGFYANPKNYDRQSRITSIYADDAHFWVEVLASGLPTDENGTGKESPHYWVAIDPTPGYEVLLAPESLWAQLFARAARTWHSLKHHPIRALSVAALLTLVWSRRAHLFDLALTAWWLVTHRWGDLRYRVTSTVRLLERRASLHGYARAKGTPLRGWGQTLASAFQTTDTWREPFIDLANWAFYGEGVPSSCSDHEVKALCQRAATAELRPSRTFRMCTSFIRRSTV